MSFKITGSGSCIPSVVQDNDTFLNHSFYDESGGEFGVDNQTIIEKFNSITGIDQRKYIPAKLTTSDIAYQAAKNAIKDADIDPETLDYIIVAHNFGDITCNSKQIDNLPSLASRVKAKLKIKNPECVAYDILFGCPGWVEAMIQAKAFIKSEMAKKCLIIGADALSRVIDSHDRDSMIYADGAGATILEASDQEGGILSHSTMTFTAEDEANFIFYGESYNKAERNGDKFIKMQGRKVYEFALSNVPAAMKKCLDDAGVTIGDLKKIFIHQANKKMDEAIVKRFFRLYKTPMPQDILPMNIEEFGNSSVATVPTLFDLVLKENYKGHVLAKGDIILFASVGAGMNINAITYQV
jgi:3-oxoacyl-[acyl-carrier-protein] synthase-3|tara:strand:- start:2536 stop:3597 length:1062 start_codon:yes stop_codon:yes gene_type:complete